MFRLQSGVCRNVLFDRASMFHVMFHVPLPCTITMYGVLRINHVPCAHCPLPSDDWPWHGLGIGIPPKRLPQPRSICHTPYCPPSRSLPHTPSKQLHLTRSLTDPASPWWWRSVDVASAHHCCPSPVPLHGRPLTGAVCQWLLPAVNCTPRITHSLTAVPVGWHPILFPATWVLRHQPCSVAKPIA